MLDVVVVINDTISHEMINETITINDIIIHEIFTDDIITDNLINDYPHIISNSINGVTDDITIGEVITIDTINDI